MSDIVKEVVAVISDVTRKLVAGNRSPVKKALKTGLGVNITTPTKKEDDASIITLSGPPGAVEEAKKIITHLDQRAKIIVDRYGLIGTGHVKMEHYGYIGSDLKSNFPRILKNKKDQSLLGVSEEFDSVSTPDIKDSTTLNTVRDQSKPRFKIKFRDEFVPRNQSQALMLAACKDRGNSYVYASGPFGGGKTYSPLVAAMQLYSEGRIDQIIVIRPPTTASKHNPGAMPGNARKKDEPYTNGGIATNISKISFHTIDDLIAKKVLKAMTPIFEIGESYDRAFILVDEAQNLNRRQAELMVGRLGEGSIMVFAGDISGKQNDIPNEIPGLAHLIATQGAHATADSRGVLARGTAFVSFTADDSAARNPILPHVAKALNEAPEEYKKLMQEFDTYGQNPALKAVISQTGDFAQDILTKAAMETMKRYEALLKSQYPALFPTNVTRIRDHHRGGPAPMRA